MRALVDGVGGGVCVCVCVCGGGGGGGVSMRVGEAHTNTHTAHTCDTHKQICRTYDSPVHFIRAHLFKLYYHALPLHVDLEGERINTDAHLCAHMHSRIRARAHTHPITHLSTHANTNTHKCDIFTRTDLPHVRLPRALYPGAPLEALLPRAAAARGL